MLDPKAEDPFPAAFHRAFFKIDIQDPIKIGDAFWKDLASDNLNRVGIAADVENERESIIVEKIIGITKMGKSMAEVRAGIDSLLAQDTKALEGILSKEHFMQHKVIAVLVRCDTTCDMYVDASVVKSAVETCKDPQHKIANALMTFPKGRAIVLEAVAFDASVEERRESILTAEGLLPRLALNNVSVDALQEFQQVMTKLVDTMMHLSRALHPSNLHDVLTHSSLVLDKAWVSWATPIFGTDDLSAFLTKFEEGKSLGAALARTLEQFVEGCLKLGIDPSFVDACHNCSKVGGLVGAVADFLTADQPSGDVPLPVGIEALNACMESESALKSLKNRLQDAEAGTYEASLDIIDNAGNLLFRNCEVLRDARTCVTNSSKEKVTFIAESVKASFGGETVATVKIFAEGETCTDYKDCNLPHEKVSEALNTAINVGDTLFGHQLTFVSRLCELLRQASLVSPILQETLAKEPAKQLPDKVCALRIENMRAQLVHFEACTVELGEGLADLFKPTSSDKHIFKICDGQFDPAVGKEAVEQVRYMLAKFGILWTSLLEEKCNTLESFCPAGWQLKKDQMFADEALQQELIQNPHYNKIGPELIELVEANELVKKAARHAKLVDAATFSRVTSVMELAKDTVVLSWVVFKVATTIVFA